MHDAVPVSFRLPMHQELRFQSLQSILRGIKMSHDEQIATLNDLIETCKKGEERFRMGSEGAGDPHLKTELSNRARNCAQSARELQDLVLSLGGELANHSSVSGALHRRWIDIKAAILGKDDEAILTECEHGEDLAVRSYRRALDKNLLVHSVVDRQYQGVLQNHDAVKKLRDRLRGGS